MPVIRSFIILSFLCICLNCRGQQPGTGQAALAKSAFAVYKYEATAKRKVMSFANKERMAKINPVNYLAAGGLFLYQRIVSEQIQAACMYEISCSDYTKLSIQRHGFKGFLSGMDQLNCCFSGVVYDYPDFMISPGSKVRNNLNK